jgi:hypothetical protein
MKLFRCCRARSLLQSVLFLASCVTLLMTAHAGYAAGMDSPPSPLPEGIVGKWRVKSVLVDLGSGRKMQYQRDDPQLLDRSFDFEPTRIVDDAPESRECAAPGSFHVSLRLSKLLALTFAARGEHGLPPALHDFGLPVSGDPLVEALSIRCRPGRFGPRALRSARQTLGGDSVGTWVVKLSKDLLAIRWFDETILILDRRSD